MKISYNWLKSYIPNLPDKEEISKLITFKICELEEVEETKNGDVVFDMKILPDRAHDLLSHRGVAKEFAGLLGINTEDFSQNIHSESTNIFLVGNFSARADRAAQGSRNENFVSIPSNLQIKVESLLCKRYMGRIVRNIKVGPSPKWLVDYLESIGQRSINNVVDITNFILFDIGQPIHAFDLDKLASEKLIVRNAKDGESISLLSFENNKSRVVNLNETNLVIADEVEPVAIAGVKGGTKAEVDENTKNILIEVANFDSVSVRKTARKFGIQTDAVKRYENGLTPNLCELAMNEVSSLVNSLCGEVSFEDVVDIYVNKPEERKTTFTTDYISKILGTNILNEDIEKILSNYGYSYNKDGNSWEIVIPDNRLDIEGPHDMVEEIGRVYGYDKITPRLPNVKSDAKDNDIWKKICIAKSYLVSMGYKEVVTYVFVDKGDVEIMASASDKNFLRKNILDGLSKSYELNRLNSPFLGLNEVKIFEIGNVFMKGGEEIHVAYIDKKNKKESTLDEFIKDIPEDFNYVIPVAEFSNKFSLWSVFPFIYRDIAVWVPDGVEANILSDVYRELGSNLLIKDPMLVDKFSKDGRTSYAYRLIFQSHEKTLKDDEVNTIISSIEDKIKSMGFEVR